MEEKLENLVECSSKGIFENFPNNVAKFIGKL
jgi:hypothetical protein